MTRRGLRSGLVIPVVLFLSCLALAGCEEEMRSKRKVATPPPPSADSGPILGQRTQDIRRAEPEIAKGAHVATQKITAKDPISLQGNAYVTAMGKMAILNIESAVKLFQGANDRYPKDYDEFMTEIIKANHIALPKLPPYQKYAYDEKEHKLVVMEYEDLKNAPLPRPN